MQVSISSIKWDLDVDCIDDDNSQMFQILDVTQDRMGRLSVTLDPINIEDRVVVFQDNNANWHVEDQRGVVDRLTDESILSFLKDLQATIPPISVE